MFEQLRRSLNDLLERATKPEDRRIVLVRMKGTLVQAKLGLDDLRDALAQSRRKLEGEQRELATVRRRKEMAVGIKDAETVAIAERFESQHAQRINMLEEKIAIQMRELDLGEREVEDMKAEIRAAMVGGGATSSAANDALDDPLDDPLDGARDAAAHAELDALARERARTDRDADAARRLEELKRRMGK